MTDTQNKRTALAAARAAVQDKVDLIGKMADDSRAIDEALEARTAADQRIAACQQAYAETHRVALEAGWTEADLAGFGVLRADSKQRRRRRTSAAAGAKQPDAGAPAQDGGTRVAAAPPSTDPSPYGPEPLTWIGEPARSGVHPGDGAAAEGPPDTERLW